VAAKDSKDLLKHVGVTFKKLPVSWIEPIEEVNKKSRTFSTFSTELIEKMSKSDLVIHFHNWGIMEEDFINMEGLHRFYKEISYGTLDDGRKYVTAMEAQNFSIFSVIYHPEYRMFMDPNPDTIEIATLLSKYLCSEAVKNF
jgi:hypothetical protein